MDRRQFLLRGVAVGAVATLGGCTAESLQEAERQPPLFDGLGEEEVDLPVSQRLEIAERGIEAASGTNVRTLEAFESYLEDEGVLVERVAEEELAGEPILSLSYLVETGEHGLVDHLGVVAGVYAALAAAGHESELLEVTVLDTDGEAFGEYEIRRHWAEAYNAGELTAREYAHEIMITVDSA